MRGEAGVAVVLEILEYAFMQRALAAGLAVAVACSMIGLLLVLRRYSLFGDAMAHASFGGVAAGLAAGIYPIWAAYAVSIASALAVTRVSQRFDLSGDAAVAVLLSSGIAVGLVLISASGGFSVDLFSFLFGSILLVSPADLAAMVALAAAVLLILAALYRQVLHATFSEEQARAAGVRVEAITYLVVVMAGVTVVTAIQLVGILLISALFVIPNVTAMMYGRGFRQTAALSAAFSSTAVVVGILVSYAFDIAPSGTIVLVAIGILACTLAARSVGLVRINDTVCSCCNRMAGAFVSATPVARINGSVCTCRDCIFALAARSARLVRGRRGS